MRDIPTPALILGFAGLLPFLGGAALVLLPPGTVPLYGFFISEPEGGRLLLERYGTIILSFMAGCLWGFASRHGRKPSWVELGLSVTPPLAIFFGLTNDPAASCLLLTYAFAGLLLIDSLFAKRTIVVWWWLSLRIPLTIVVCACLLIGAFA
ncbi:DUF3429 domain-containing protein [Pontivivens ytuae]|uniref:DUF3429 domain-containing protein n=1 Tax=Pontivivens ytuae TaxID=2789856 RepID=A0A7S9LQK8_9RHOB|nr:DUF3429 domain-containing protein [Pontivivens ytuae]QPH53484.1 DUF3429 domain-containing protein [Pontivivens ytuae]